MMTPPPEFTGTETFIAILLPAMAPMLMVAFGIILIWWKLNKLGPATPAQAQTRPEMSGPLRPIESLRRWDAETATLHWVSPIVQPKDYRDDSEVPRC